MKTIKLVTAIALSLYMLVAAYGSYHAGLYTDTFLCVGVASVWAITSYNIKNEKE